MESHCLFQARCPNDTVLVKAPPGRAIFMPDQLVLYCYHVHYGAVGVFAPTPEGQEILLQLSVPPNFIGLLPFTGMDSDQPMYHPGEARALTSAVYCRVKRQAVWDLLDDRQARAKIFDMIYSTVFLIARLSSAPLRNDVRLRLVMVLYALTKAVGESRSDASIVIPSVSQEVIAALGSTTRATVARVLKQLERDGIVVTGRREIIIPSPRNLMAKCALLPPVVI